jgi:archaellum component FlaC
MDTDRIVNKLEEHDERFDKVDRWTAGADHKFDSIEKKFEAVDRRFDQVDQRFEAVDRRFDQVDRGSMQSIRSVRIMMKMRYLSAEIART